jgi:hypothetical protein
VLQTCSQLDSKQVGSALNFGWKNTVDHPPHARVVNDVQNAISEPALRFVGHAPAKSLDRSSS